MLPILKIKIKYCISLGSFLLCNVFITALQAQSVKLLVKETLQKIESHLPALESYRQLAAAAQQNISLAKNTSVPDLTVGYQVNMATYNNITGMSYPGFLLPISGPPSLNNDINFVPGSAIGALVKWNPFTFGRRPAAIEKAEAQFKQANAAYNEQLFQYQYTAMNNYLQALYYKQVIKSVEASIERNKIGLEQSLVLAQNGLKAGIDTTQFQASIAQSEIDLLQAQRTYQQVLTELKWLTGTEAPNDKIILTDSFFA
ncbi:MAG: outer rane efflux protein, partial [Ferruginibacter sp.]|nr:outer rane efflux protein [Ferruginibacter sp.]